MLRVEPTVDLRELPVVGLMLRRRPRRTRALWRATAPCPGRTRTFAGLAIALLVAAAASASTQPDIDLDGDLDLLFLSSGGRPRLLRNDQQTGNRSLRVTFGQETNVISTTLTINLWNGTRLTRTVMPTCSYQSQSELPLTIGLGRDQEISSAFVTWPDGSTADVQIPADATSIDVAR